MKPRAALAQATCFVAAVCFAQAICFTATMARAADWGVAQLFESLAKQKVTRATFQERKFLAILDKPVESSGELVFTPPDRLEKRTLRPKPESVVVDRDIVTLERGGKRSSLSLGNNPAIAVLIESIRSTLAGDLALLTRTYSAGLDGSPARWKLVLRPLDPSLGVLVERIEIGGAQAQVRTVEIFQADGDRSLMTLSPLAP
jgi:Outer membrane lipoprotein carrier protein LolA-like